MWQIESTVPYTDFILSTVSTEVFYEIMSQNTEEFLQQRKPVGWLMWGEMW